MQDDRQICRVAVRPRRQAPQIHHHWHGVTPDQIADALGRIYEDK